MSAAAGSGARRRGWLVLGLFVAATLFGFTLCHRGIILSDEGYLLLQSLDLAHGKVLYRDMDAFVAPGVWFLLAALFRLVEPSVLASRMLALVCYLATLAVCLRIVLRLTDRRTALAAAGALFVCTVWAFPAWTWSFYSPWSMLFALAALERLLAWRDGGRAGALWAAGVALGLSLLFKQNYGAQALLGVAVGVVAIRLEAEPGLAPLWRTLPSAGARLAGGVVAVWLPAAAWFAQRSALGAAFEAIFVQPFGNFLGQHDIAYLPLSELFERRLMAGTGRLTYGAFAFTNTALRFAWPGLLTRGIEGLHVVLYWLPPLVGVAAAWLLWRTRRDEGRLDAGLAATFAVCGALFLGVFPRADFNHLMNVYQPVIVLGSVVAARAAARVPRPPGLAVRVLRGAALALAAVYTGVAAYWYVDLLRWVDSEIPGRGGVLVSRESRQMLDFEVNAIRAATRPGEPVLTLPGFSMLNFLAGRPMPSRYYNLYAVHVAHDGGAGVARAAEAHRVRLVVADYYDFFSERVGMREYAPELVRYLRRYFEPLFSVAVDEHLFLRRRARPLPDRSWRSALEDCDVGGFDWALRGVGDHLLFRSLYHPLQLADGSVRPEVETLCRVRVPPGADLAFGLGYRQPMQVAPGTELTAEVWVVHLDHPGEAPVRIYREALEPVPATGWSSPPPIEQRIDLGRFAGEEVTLLFRSLYHGDARMNPLDFKGFSMVWQDPQIEFDGASR